MIVRAEVRHGAIIAEAVVVSVASRVGACGGVVSLGVVSHSSYQPSIKATPTGRAEAMAQINRSAALATHALSKLCHTK